MIRVAVAGARIYGATIALRLAADGYDVHLFDPFGGDPGCVRD
jgi:2-polyprenyl-6-methoxyphenol hydroxylase-like FAD-dependent oxidoreductase